MGDGWDLGFIGLGGIGERAEINSGWKGKIIPPPSGGGWFWFSPTLGGGR